MPKRVARPPVHVVIDGLSELADAIRYAARVDARARRFEARVRAGIIHAKQKVEPGQETEFDKWRAGALARDLEPSEVEHLRWAYQVLSGKLIASAQDRIEAGVVYSNAQAPYGLPEIPRS